MTRASATTEYNHSVSSVLTNALAWLSRDGADGPPPLARKPVALVSVAGYSGGMRAQSHMRDILHYLRMPLLNEPELLLNAHDARKPRRFCPETGDLLDADARARLGDVVDALVEWTARLGPVAAKCLGPTKLA